LGVGDYFDIFETHIAILYFDQCLNIEKWGVLAVLGYRSISWCPNSFKLENSAFFGVGTLMVIVSMPLHFFDPFLEQYF
jgi:hypothetical protein